MFNMKDSRLNFCKVDSNPSVEHLPCLITESVPAMQYWLAKADRWLPEEKKFYHQFSIVKYSYLPTDTFRKYVERHVT